MRQTDFSNDEAVGFLADRLNRLGVEARLVELGADEGDAVLIGARTTPWSSTSSPASTPAPRCSAVAARTSRLEEPRPAAGRRRAIEEAMADRAESEARADVARRLDRAATEVRAARPAPTSLRDRLADDPDRTPT